MKELNVLALDVKPAIPQPNSLVVVNDKVFHYDNNNVETSIGGESIDPSNYVTTNQFTTANSAMNTRVTTLETKAPLTWATITGKPATFAPVIGTTATTALAGNTVIPAAATWANISGKPAVVAAGADAATARTSIGAGTSNLALGTTASTAKAGNYVPTTLEVVTALKAMTAGQITEIQTLLGITPA